MRTFGLVGYPLGHSFSKGYFTEKFSREGADCRYLNFEIEDIGQITDIVTHEPTLEGFNVTIPYKEKIIPYLSFISEQARAIGAVNCVLVTGGSLTGFNTDAMGAGKTIDRLLGGNTTVSALVLGSGGASKAVRYALSERSIDFLTVSRKTSAQSITYEQLTPEVIATHELIINTTPLGMYPKTDAAPDIPYGLLTPHHKLFDLVYNPSQTEFIKRGLARGAKAVNGLEMLEAQAEESWRIWNEI